MPLLNAKMLKALTPPATCRTELSDTLVRGLKFRLTPNGVASWSLQMNARGEKRRFTLGEYPVMGLAEARSTAEKLKAEVKAGRDPIRDERAAREAAVSPAARVQTIGDVLETYASMHLGGLKTGNERRRQLDAALASILETPMTSLTRVDLQRAIDRKAEEGRLVAANRLRAALSHFSRWAWQRGLLPESIGGMTVKAAPERPRDRLLSLDEVRVIYDLAPGLGPVWGPFVRLLLLTAQRRGEVASMRSDELDLSARRWTIPSARSKNRRGHIVHLAEPVREILKGMLPDQSDPAFVFTTTGRTPVSGFSRVKERMNGLLRKERPHVDMAPWRWHDFRTAFASHMADEGTPETVVDRVLNHVASASSASTVARVYNQAELLPQRAQALDGWAQLVVRRARGEEGGDV